MQKYISNLNLNQIFKADKSSTPVSRPESRQKLDENPIYGQELRQNFFMKAFEIYLEKVLSKNQEKLQKDRLKPSAQVKRFYEDDEENPNLPETLRNVQRLIKQRKKQNKLMGASKVEKFEKKMEIFKDLHSFVDIRSFLLESNVANYNNSEELLITLKSHYKDGLNMVLSEEKVPKITRNSKNVYTYSPKHKVAFRTEAEQLDFAKDTLEQRMKKYKDLIDLSKETVTQAVRRESEHHISEGISKDLYTHLSEKLKLGQKSNSNANEEATRDNKFNESLEDLERRFIYAQKYLQVARKKGNKEILSEDQKEKQKQEVEQFNTMIKKILLRGVVGEDGGPSANEYYLNEYKTQYKKIKKVLHKVTKNIYKRDLDSVKEKSPIHTRMSSFNRFSIQNESDPRLPSLRGGAFLTEVDKNPYFLDEHKNNTSFIQKNIQEVEKSNRRSLINDQVKETTDFSLPQNSARKKTIQLPKIITHLQEKRGGSFEPYFLKSESERSIPNSNNSGYSSKRSYKKENRVIQKRFDQFLKNINRVETTQKFLTDDLKENMGEMAKEMNKLNVGAFAEPLSSIREVDPQGFTSGKNLNGMKKAMKKFSNLNI